MRNFFPQLNRLFYDHVRLKFLRGQNDRSSELQASIALLTERVDRDSYLEIEIPVKKLKTLTPKQKEDACLVLASILVSVPEEEKGYWNTVAESFYRKIDRSLGHPGNRNFHLCSRDFSERLDPYESRIRTNTQYWLLIRRIKQKIKDNKTVLDLILECFTLTPRIISKRRPRPTIRHKGYRDHGSLGSSTSQANKEYLNSDQQKNDIIDLERKEIYDWYNSFLEDEIESWD